MSQSRIISVYRMFCSLVFFSSKSIRANYAKAMMHPTPLKIDLFVCSCLRILSWLHPCILHGAHMDAAQVNPLAVCRGGCLSSCQTRCFGLSCATPSTWSTRPKCRVAEVCLRRIWSSWLKRLSAAPATTLTTTATWQWPGHSLTGSALLSVSPLSTSINTQLMQGANYLLLLVLMYGFPEGSLLPAFWKMPTGHV